MRRSVADWLLIAACAVLGVACLFTPIPRWVCKLIWVPAVCRLMSLGVAPAARRMMTLPEPGYRAGQYAWAARGFMLIPFAACAAWGIHHVAVGAPRAAASWGAGCLYLLLESLSLRCPRPEWKRGALIDLVREGIRWDVSLCAAILAISCVFYDLHLAGCCAGMVLALLFTGEEGDQGERETRRQALRFLLTGLIMLLTIPLRGGPLALALAYLEMELRYDNTKGLAVALVCCALGAAGLFFPAVLWALPVVLVLGALLQKDAFYAAWLPIRARFIRRRAHKGNR